MVIEGERERRDLDRGREIGIDDTAAEAGRRGGEAEAGECVCVCEREREREREKTRTIL